MRPVVGIISAVADGRAERRLKALLKVWGVGSVALPQVAEAEAATHPLTVVDLESFCGRHDDIDHLKDWIRRSTPTGRRVLLWGATGDAGIHALLGELTQGSILGVSEFKGRLKYSVKPTDWAGSLSGVSVRTTRERFERGLRLNTAPEQSTEVVVGVGHDALLVRIAQGGVELLVLSTSEVLDVEERVDRLSERDAFPGFIPLLMVLRKTFGNALWHSTGQFACLTIDDPPLTPRYGLLRYDRLFADMEHHAFSTTVAFVPCNHRLTSRRTAELAKRADDRFSLCVHGCDHKRGEYAQVDRETLARMASTGLGRMERHKRRTGLGFDHVMVFPGGKFSATAMEVLRDAGYLAAVNSGPSASDDSLPYKVADFLSPALDRYGGLPLFLRRYPTGPESFALEAFLGRPALIAAHPSDFGARYHRILSVARMLNALKDPPAWRTLNSIVEQTHVERSLPNGDVQVKALSSRLRLTNATDIDRRYTVFQGVEPAAQGIATLDESPMEVRTIAGIRFVSFSLPAHASVTVCMRVDTTPAADGMRYSVSDRLLNSMRRVGWRLRDELAYYREAFAQK